MKDTEIEKLVCEAEQVPLAHVRLMESVYAPPICEWMMFNRAMTVDEISASAGLSKSEVRRQLRKMTKEGTAERESGRRAWRLNND